MLSVQACDCLFIDFVAVLYHLCEDCVPLPDPRIRDQIQEAIGLRLYSINACDVDIIKLNSYALVYKVAPSL
jgi:hypothetical protein